MHLNIFLFAEMENDVSDLYTREREFIFDLQNLVDWQMHVMR